MNRVNPFQDLNDFQPKAQPKPVEQAQIDRIAEDNGFPSRQAPRPAEAMPRKQRRYRTGRNQQFNIKATPETIQRFCRVADALDVPYGELLDRALDALEAAKPAG